MQTATLTWTATAGWSPRRIGFDPDLVLYFGDRVALEDGLCHATLCALAPEAQLFGCSSGGHFLAGEIADRGAVGIALRFAATGLRLAAHPLAAPGDSAAAGAALGAALRAPDLAGVFLLADGLGVFGTDLAVALSAAVGAKVPVTGGLAGDGDAFGRTLVAADAPPRPGLVAALGFYGDRIRFSHGSAGGWDAFGSRRRITRADRHQLFELDDCPALALYERYLGAEAAGLPGTGLLYPLKVWDPAQPAHEVVRTLLAVDRASGSLRFAGAVPQGWRAQLMRGQLDRLATAAGAAAAAAAPPTPCDGESLAILVSSIGRRLLMGPRTSQELDAAALALGPAVRRIGFYAQGEIAPHPVTGGVEMHNQTMTVTLLGERGA
jgi:hypothetical protein